METLVIIYGCLAFHGLLQLCPSVLYQLREGPAVSQNSCSSAVLEEVAVSFGLILS